MLTKELITKSIITLIIAGYDNRHLLDGIIDRIEPNIPTHHTHMDMPYMDIGVFKSIIRSEVIKNILSDIDTHQPETKIIHINIEPNIFNKNYMKNMKNIIKLYNIANELDISFIISSMNGKVPTRLLYSFPLIANINNLGNVEIIKSRWEIDK